MLCCFAHITAFFILYTHIICYDFSFISFRMKFGFYCILKKNAFTYDRIISNGSELGNTSKIEYYVRWLPFTIHFKLSFDGNAGSVDRPLLIRLHPLALLRLATFQPKYSNCPLTVHLKANRLPNTTSSTARGRMGMFLVEVSGRTLSCQTNVVKIHEGQCAVCIVYINDVIHKHIPMIC